MKDAGSLTLGPDASRVAELTVTDSSLSVRVLFDPAGSPIAAVNATPPSPGSRTSPGPKTSRMIASSAIARAVAISACMSRVRYIRYGWNTTIRWPLPASSRSVCRAAVIEVGW